MINYNHYAESFNFLLEKIVKKETNNKKIKKYNINYEDYNLFYFNSILKQDFDIKTIVARIEIEDIESIPFPALVFLKLNGGTFAIVNSYEKGKIYWENIDFGKQINTMTLFNKICENIFLFVDYEADDSYA
ncbi:hypothetical protein MKJ01_01915 [Chryseobacterium sp. SSA4.19]|uniref:hypothetical protein n=1 Tax=Chryseobacterium sp. SSA4.19 TaxID=2919915 RepID=UPI001F4D7BAF|nr:hypothetical protein [Chryseobacterium sp. SSA4.19]MCJ8152514.1 hypothetical protein [Chryseobacterium sp. SSA4.19]